MPEATLPLLQEACQRLEQAVDRLEDRLAIERRDAGRDVLDAKDTIRELEGSQNRARQKVDDALRRIDRLLATSDA